MRCLTLANALAEGGARITFVAAAMPPALEERIAGAGHKIERIPTSPGLRREGPDWEEPPLSVEAQLADAKETGAAAGRSDWIIVDHYLLNDCWHSAARRFADNILVIDDLANRSYDCDILLDQTHGRSAEDYRELVPDGARILAGSTYALLRPEFARERPAALRRREAGGPVRRILISLGTADPDGITARLTEHTIAATPQFLIDVVMGPQAASLDYVRELAARHSGISIHVDSKRMAELIRDADIAIGAAGMSALERCCLGLPSIILCLAENQRTNAAALETSGAAFVTADPAEASKRLVQLCRDGEARISAENAAFKITDGVGAQRVVDACTYWTGA